jgi:6-phosphogluconolactonase
MNAAIGFGYISGFAGADALAAAAAAELFAAAVPAAVRRVEWRGSRSPAARTPKAMFALLADPAQPYFARVPWDKLQLFWVDERCVPPTMRSRTTA